MCSSDLVGYIKDVTGSYTDGLLALAGCAILSSVLAVAMTPSATDA